MRVVFICILFSLNLLIILNEDCSIFDDEYLCEEGQLSYNEQSDEDAFQTPPRNDTYGRYRTTYQDMHYLVGYTQLKYSLDQKNCTVKIITKVNAKLGKEGIDYYFIYKFGENKVKEDSITLYAEIDSYPKGLSISAIIIDLKTDNEIARLDLEDEYFIWDNPEVSQSEEYENGLRGSIVELFGWPYEDIAEECEFIGHAGYLGIKIYSPNEHILTYDLVENNVVNPWWYITQTVSYKLNSRLGDKKQLKCMIDTCRKYNVRVYAGILINHMTGGGNDMYDDHRGGISEICHHWGPKTGSAGSPYWTISNRYENNSYTGKRPVLEYPSVPYFPSDFHCRLDIKDWYDIDQLINGWLAGMADVNIEKGYVQQRIADYFTELLSLGMSGVSISNGKQMLPESIAKIFKKLKENFGGKLPKDFLGVIQIQYGNQKDITMCDDESKLSYGIPFKEKLEELGFSEEEITQIKIWNTDFLKDEYPFCEDEKEWKVDPIRVVISTEYTDDINLSNDYNIYIRDKNIEFHRNSIVNMFNIEEYNFKIRNVFSMFSLYNNSNGYPDGKSDCSLCQTDICRNGCTKSFPYRKAYNPLSIGYDTGNESNWVEGEYTRVHRDKDIINAMRRWMGFEPMNESELYDAEKVKAKCGEKCLICNDKSEIGNLWLSCNLSGEYYPLIYQGAKHKYYECHQFLDLIRDDILEGLLDEIIFKKLNEEKEDMMIKKRDIIYQISSPEIQENNEYNDSSNILFSDCETKLKTENNIPENLSLVILKIDYFFPELKIPLVEYEVYNPVTKKVLDLNICNSIEVVYPINNQIDEEILFKYDPNSEYYNDKCYPYTTIYNTDITLNDRKEEYNKNNMGLCEKNCEFVGLKYDMKYKSRCDCKPKNAIKNMFDINKEKDKLIHKFIDFNSTLNLDVIYCYDLLFNKKGFKNNVGNYILLSIILIHFTGILLFILKGFKLIKAQIKDILRLKIEKIKQNILHRNNTFDMIKQKKDNRIINIKNNREKINTILNNFSPKVSKDNSSKLSIYSKNDLNIKRNKILNNSYLDINIINPEEAIKIKYLINPTDNEMNSLNYDKALKYDKRTFIQYYISLLKTNHLLLFTFFNHNDYNSFIVKLLLFFFNFSLLYTVDSLFYQDKSLHKIYKDKGKFDFFDKIQIIIYSTIISTIITLIIKYFALNEKNLIEIKNSEINNLEMSSKKVTEVIKCLKIKFVNFFILSNLFLIMFWYYMSCFCAVFKNTQFQVLKDALISFGLSFVYPFVISLLPGLFRIPSLRKAKRKKLYFISRVIQLF